MVDEGLINKIQRLNGRGNKDLVGISLDLYDHLHPFGEVKTFRRKLGTVRDALTTKIKGLNPEASHKALNKYFFNELGFTTNPSNAQTLGSSSWWMTNILSQHTGHPFPVSMLYLDLAQSMNLNVELIHQPRHGVLKWKQPDGHCHYIAVTEGGRCLSQQELVKFARECKGFDRIDGKAGFLHYLHGVIQCLGREGSPDTLKRALDLGLLLKQDDLKWLETRALLLRKMGRAKEALEDLKRYFSFFNKTEAPYDIMMAYYELKSLHQAEPSKTVH